MIIQRVSRSAIVSEFASQNPYHGLGWCEDSKDLDNVLFINKAIT